jgi:hypothetical protein
MPKTDVVVNLSGNNGNAFSIIGQVTKALKRADHSDLVDEFQKEAMSGDYDHLLQTAMEYVVVE